MKKIRAYAWAAIIVLAIAVFVLLFHLGSDSGEFSRYNTEWNGTSSFFSSLDRHEVVEIQDPGDLAGYTNTTLLVLAPERKYRESDITAYRNYVARGNTLILADDFGTGNILLQGLGVSASILPGDLSSVDRAYADPAMVIGYVSDPSLASLEGKGILFDRPAAVTGDFPEVRTGILSWVDEDLNGKIDREEPLGKYSLVARETLGKGDVWIVGDASIFINSISGESEQYFTAAFIHDILGTREKILVDTWSTRPVQADSVRGVLHALQTSIDYRVMLAGVFMLAIAVVWHRKWL